MTFRLADARSRPRNIPNPVPVRCKTCRRVGMANGWLMRGKKRTVERCDLCR